MEYECVFWTSVNINTPHLYGVFIIIIFIIHTINIKLVLCSFCKALSRNCKLKRRCISNDINPFKHLRLLQKPSSDSVQYKVNCRQSQILSLLAKKQTLSSNQWMNANLLINQDWLFMFWFKGQSSCHLFTYKIHKLTQRLIILFIVLVCFSDSRC